MQNESQTSTLDPQAVNLAKAIRFTESGGDQSAEGASGEHGAYQFMPDTWKSNASKYGVTSDLKGSSLEDQNKVAYGMIKAWKDQGYNPAQIASLWNSGKPDWQGNVGVNKAGVKYDTPKYVNSVYDAYQQIKGGNEHPIIQPNSSTVNPNTQAAPLTPQQQTQIQQPQQSFRSKILGGITGAANYISKPFEDIAAIPVQAGLGLFNKLTGSHIADPYSTGQGLGGNVLSPVSDIGGKGSSALQVAGDIGAAATAGGLLGVLKGGTALTSPVIKTAMADFNMPMSEFNALSAAEKANALTEALNNATAGTKPIIQKAIQEVAPQVLREAGVGSFSELHPALAKTLGIGGKALKYLASVGLGAGLGALGSSEIKKVGGLLQKI